MTLARKPNSDDRSDIAENLEDGNREECGAWQTENKRARERERDRERDRERETDRQTERERERERVRERVRRRDRE